MKRPQLCVDDYGMANSVHRGTIELIHEGKVDSVSIMTVCEGWDRDLDELIKIADENSVQIGLHFCMTGSALKPLFVASTETGYTNTFGNFLSPGRVFLSSIFGKIQKDKVSSELRRQYSALQDKVSIVHHIDGHHHCHQWGVISETVLEFVSQLELKPKVRNTWVPLGILLQIPSMKLIFLSFFGNRLRQKLLIQNIPTNEGFFIYPNYKEISVQHWKRVWSIISRYGDNILFCVHISSDGEDIKGIDPLTVQRKVELQCIKKFVPQN